LRVACGELLGLKKFREHSRDLLGRDLPGVLACIRVQAIATEHFEHWKRGPTVWTAKGNELIRVHLV
ncbi:MAG: hypothetical protein WCK15_03050, partial [Pirellula sp.]